METGNTKQSSHQVCQTQGLTHTLELTLTPQLSPGKLQLLVAGQMLLQRIVHPLNEHGLHTHPLQEVRHRWGVAKWVNGPT